MTEGASIQASADRLWQAWQSGVPCSPIRGLLDAGDGAAAYAAQEINTRRWLGSEERILSGRKIDATSRDVQRHLAVDQPVYGMLFADMEVMDGEEVSPHRVLQARVQTGIAFVVAAPLTGGHLTMVDLMASIGYVVPAIEVTGSRIGGWDLSITDMIADNASSGLYGLGQSPKRISDFDQRLCGMVMFRNGEPASYGAGVACMGSPLNAILWLARGLARAGRPLGPGDLVLSGPLGPAVQVMPGDFFESYVSGLGSVRIAFSRA